MFLKHCQHKLYPHFSKNTFQIPNINVAGSLNLYKQMIFTFLLTSQVENDTCNEEKYITKQENKVVHDPN